MPVRKKKIWLSHVMNGIQKTLVLEKAIFQENGIKIHCEAQKALKIYVYLDFTRKIKFSSSNCQIFVRKRAKQNEV